MNINSLPKGSYTPVTGGLNINSLPGGTATPVTQPAAPKQSIADKIWATLSAPANYLKDNMNSAASAGADQINQGITTIQNGVGNGNPILGGLKAAGQVSAGIVQVGSSALAGLYRPALAAVQAAGNLSENISENLPGSSPQKVQQFANSTLGTKTADVAQSLSDYGTIAGGILGAKGAVDSFPNAQAGVNGTVSQIQDLLKTSPEVKAANLSASETATMGDQIGKISDTIAPKLTAKETKLALADGRIAPGSDPGILRDGTPDQVLPSTKQAQAAFTIHQNIPDAAIMSPPELYTALDGKISELASGLRPAMEATPITEPIISKITSDWDALKQQQLADPYTPTTANLEKLQTNFEQNFLQKSGADNMGDLWDTRIRYDNSVPLSVKNATSLSSETLQAQKSIWLQNRGILNAAINDTASGMDGVAQKTFTEMSDMYNAQKGIQSSYKVSNTGAPSQLKQLAQNHPVITKVLKAGAKAVGLGAGVHVGENLVP